MKCVPDSLIDLKNPRITKCVKCGNLFDTYNEIPECMPTRPHLISIKEEKEITKQQAYINVLEWLYANDGKYADKLKWRESLIEVLRFNLK